MDTRVRNERVPQFPFSSLLDCGLVRYFLWNLIPLEPDQLLNNKEEAAYRETRTRAPQLGQKLAHLEGSLPNMVQLAMRFNPVSEWPLQL